MGLKCLRRRFHTSFSSSSPFWKHRIAIASHPIPAQHQKLPESLNALVLIGFEFIPSKLMQAGSTQDKIALQLSATVPSVGFDLSLADFCRSYHSWSSGISRPFGRRTDVWGVSVYNRNPIFRGSSECKQHRISTMFLPHNLGLPDSGEVRRFWKCGLGSESRSSPP